MQIINSQNIPIDLINR